MWGRRTPAVCTLPARTAIRTPRKPDWSHSPLKRSSLCPLQAQRCAVSLHSPGLSRQEGQAASACIRPPPCRHSLALLVVGPRRLMAILTEEQTDGDS